MPLVLVAEAPSAGFDELYAYDGLYRLANLQRGTLSNPKSEIQNPKFSQCWTLDATGNWKGFREDDTGSGTWDLVQSRTANTVNEITGITNTTGTAWATPAYDSNGNMTSLPKPTAPQSGFTGTYDAWNQLVKLTDATSGNTVQQNAYDGLRRRTVKQAYTAGTLSETRHYYFSSSWQVAEERVGTSANAERQFVWGLRYIDDLILRDRDTNNDGALDERMFALQDPNWNVVGLTDSSGNMQERYSYDAYGMPTVLTATFGSRSSSSYAWETLYAGYRYDADTGLYLLRNRILEARTGTWGQRDSVGYAAGSSLYQVVSSRPISLVDPFGLQAQWQLELTGNAAQGTVAAAWQSGPMLTKFVPRLNYEGALTNGIFPNSPGPGGPGAMVYGGPSNWIPVSTNPFGGQGYGRGRLIFVDPNRLRGRYLPPSELQDIVSRSPESEIPRSSKGPWKRIQVRDVGRTLRDPFGLVNPTSGQCPGGKSWTNLEQLYRGGEQEGAVYGNIPRESLYGKAYGRTYQGLRYGGKLLLPYAAYNTYTQLDEAAQQSEQIGSMEPFHEAVAEQAGGWGAGGLGGMGGGALAGTLGAGPIGTFVGGLVGGVGGAFGGSKACGGMYRGGRDFKGPEPTDYGIYGGLLP